jgi:predicted Zn-dependent protease
MLKKLVYLFIIGAVVLAGAWYGRKGYRKWNQGHLVKQARTYLATNDYRNAGLCLQRAVKINANNPETCVLMAELSEAVGYREAIGWRERLVKLQPDQPQRRLDLAITALRFNDIPRAEKALEELGSTNRNTAIYHKAAATVAIARNNPTNAELHLVEALKLQPNDKRDQLNLAILRLQAKDPKARQTLETIAADPEFKRDALRALITRALNEKENNQALTYSRQLIAATNAQTGDRLVHLEVLTRAGQPETNTYLVSIQQQAAKSTPEVVQVTSWMLGKGRHQALLQWLDTLATNIQSQIPVQAAKSDCYARANQWVEMEKLLKGVNWGPFDYMRLASLSLAMRGQKLTSGADARWKDAVAAAGNRLERLTALLQAAAGFGWEREAEGILWTIQGKYPREGWVYQGLLIKLQKDKNTRGLHQLYTKMLDVDPKNPALKNNVALLSILLNLQVPKAHALAKEIYTAYPTNLTFNSTYAYSLYTQGKTNEAVQTIQQLTPQQLDDPSVAAYYGVILMGVGDKAKGLQCLQKVDTTKMLPEEQAMVARAKGAG